MKPTKDCKLAFTPQIPYCNACEGAFNEQKNTNDIENSVPRAKYVCKTTYGFWGYFCEFHFRMFGIGLGTDKGQLLVLEQNPLVSWGPNGVVPITSLICNDESRPPTPNNHRRRKNYLGIKIGRYISILKYENGKKHYINEHRILMENHLKRKLLNNEVVHHVDGNPFNNNLENLVVLTSGEHSSLHNKARSGNKKYLHNLKTRNKISKSIAKWHKKWKINYKDSKRTGEYNVVAR